MAHSGRSLSSPLKAPLLVFAWGNPARGDDALGPLFSERLAAARLPWVECRCEYQLQVEHALELIGRRFVLFADASSDAPSPFQRHKLSPLRDKSIFSHALSPAALLAVCQELFGPPPLAELWAIRGEDFALGAPLSAAASRHLEAAVAAAMKMLSAL